MRNSTGSTKSSSAGGDPTTDAWQTYLGMSFAQNGLCRETIVHGYLAVCVLRGDLIAKGSNDIKLHMSYEVSASLILLIVVSAYNQHVTDYVTSCTI